MLWVGSTGSTGAFNPVSFRFHKWWELLCPLLCPAGATLTCTLEGGGEAGGFTTQTRPPTKGGHWLGTHGRSRHYTGVHGHHGEANKDGTKANEELTHIPPGQGPAGSDPASQGKKVVWPVMGVPKKTSFTPQEDAESAFLAVQSKEAIMDEPLASVKDGSNVGEKDVEAIVEEAEVEESVAPKEERNDVEQEEMEKDTVEEVVEQKFEGNEPLKECAALAVEKPLIPKEEEKLVDEAMVDADVDRDAVREEGAPNAIVETQATPALWDSKWLILWSKFNKHEPTFHTGQGYNLKFQMATLYLKSQIVAGDSSAPQVGHPLAPSPRGGGATKT